MSRGNAEIPPSRPCPLCGKPGCDRYRPFCSKRCADIDLGRWFGEGYRIPAEEGPEDDLDDLQDPGTAQIPPAPRRFD